MSAKSRLYRVGVFGLMLTCSVLLGQYVTSRIMYGGTVFVPLTLAVVSLVLLLAMIAARSHELMTKRLLVTTALLTAVLAICQTQFSMSSTNFFLTHIVMAASGILGCFLAAMRVKPPRPVATKR